MVESEELFSHAALITEEITLHAVHKVLESPEGDGIVLHDGVNRSQEIGHALNVAEVAVIFVVCEQHVFHLLEMDIGPHIRERR